VTIVEFFDYQCGYCKQVSEDLTNVIIRDDGVKVIFKEFPILGEASVIGAKAALSAKQFGTEAYWKFHHALMKTELEIDLDAIQSIAADLGLDGDKIIAGMEDEKVTSELEDNYRLAELLNISGTPGFIINEEIFFGAIDESAMIESIALARQ